MYEPRRVNLSVLAPRQNVSCNTNKACHKRSIAEMLTKVRFPYAAGRNLDPLSLADSRVDAWDQVVLLPLLSRQYLNNASMVHGSHPITVPRCCWIEFELIFDLSGTHHITTLSWVGCGFSWVWSSVKKIVRWKPCIFFCYRVKKWLLVPTANGIIYDFKII